MTDKKAIKGTTLFGDERKYEFNLMDAETGLEVFHEVVSVVMYKLPELVGSFPKLKEFIADMQKSVANGTAVDAEKTELKIDASMLEVARFIPTILTIDRIKELAKKMLPGAVVTIDGKEVTIGDDGFADYMTGDPLEVYTAVVYGMQANYPKYFSFLAESPDEETGKDSTPS